MLKLPQKNMINKQAQGEITIKDTDYWIKKLGSRFRSLILHTGHGSWANKPKWQAKANHHIANFGKSIKGNTPEEALENLYNELAKAGKLIK